MKLKQKVQLKSKGQIACLPTIKQALIHLKWKTSKDFDLMAFITKNDGTQHGVFTDNLGGDLGNANAFPYMVLSGDAGVNGDVADDGNIETLKITKIDDSIKQIDLVAFNYSDALVKKYSSFSDYDASITLVNDSGESFEINLNSTEKGIAAIVATIVNNPVGAVIQNKSIVTTLEGLIDIVPGAVVLTK